MKGPEERHPGKNHLQGYVVTGTLRKGLSRGSSAGSSNQEMAC